MGQDRTDAQKKLQEAADREHDLEAEFRRAAEATDRAIAHARDAGLGWDAIAETTGLDVRQAQYRLSRASGKPAADGKARPGRAGERQHATDISPPGTVTVSEAARRLGLESRSSVYRLIQDGALEVVLSSSGRQRVTEASIEARLGMQDASVSGLTVSEAARRLGVTRTTVDSLLDAGRLEAVPESRPRRVDVDSARRYRAKVSEVESSSTTITDAAKRLGVGRQTVARMLDDGRLEAVADSKGDRRVSIASIDKYLRKEAGWLSPTDAAAKLSVSRAAIYRMVQSGEIQSRETPGGLRVRLDSM